MNQSTELLLSSVREHGAECHRRGPVEEDTGLAELSQRADLNGDRHVCTHTHACCTLGHTHTAHTACICAGT